MEDDHSENEEGMVDFVVVPDELKALRACLRCGLVKNYIQFEENGCENCDMLNMKDSSKAVHKCTTPYFEGMIGLTDPQGSWVAKWNGVGT